MTNKCTRSYKDQGSNYSPIEPILTEPRLPAEWEKQAAILLTWPHEETDWIDILHRAEEVYVNLTKQICRYEPVIIVANNEEHKAHIQRLLTEDADSERHSISIYCCASNDTWARDHGPISIMDSNKMALLNFIFNGWGGKYEAAFDNNITPSLYQQNAFQSLPLLHSQPTSLVSHDYVLEGGGIESDGAGTLLATRRCLLAKTRNPAFNTSENEAFLKATFGLDRILWLDHGELEGDDTDSHIDTLARFISPSHIIYQACDDPSDNHFNALTQMANQLRTFTQSNGLPYQLSALPWPQACVNDQGERLPATYANFLFINGAVLVPTYNVPQDRLAIALFESLFSGHTEGIEKRQVIALNCRPLIEQFGSLHCVTMNIMSP